MTDHSDWLDRMMQNEILFFVVCISVQLKDDTMAWFKRLQEEADDGD